MSNSYQEKMIANELRIEALEKAHNNLAGFTQKMSGLIYALIACGEVRYDNIIVNAMDSEVIKQVGKRLGEEELKIIAAREAAKKEGVV